MRCIELAAILGSRNLEFVLSTKGIDGEAKKTRARDWLDRVGLGHQGRAYPGELSGGEQQRVALARALV